MVRNNCLSTLYSGKTIKSLSRGTRSYAFARSTELAKRFLPYSQDFSKICFRVKIIMVCGAATRTKTSLAILQLRSHYFSAFPFKAFGVYFPWQTKKWCSSVVRTLLAISFFLNFGIIKPVCQSRGLSSYFHETWHTRLNQIIFSPVSVLNICRLISFLPAAFPDFIPLIAVATSDVVKTSSFHKCITSSESWFDAFTGFKRSSRYSLHRERISFSSMRILSAES